ncbi:hypothetical protein ACM9XB_06520 [Xanthomonas sacchari]
MGQAKNRGSREERIAQAVASGGDKKNTQTSTKLRLPKSPAEAIEWHQRLAALFRRLTTPREIDANVVAFASELSESPPIFVDGQPELWSRKDCCDLNVAKYIEAHGGSALCGYRIWYSEPDYIEGERHMVWTDGEAIRDVSFVVSGEETTVFVPDKLDFEKAPDKVRKGLTDDSRMLLAFHEMIEGMQPPITRSSEAAWETTQTYAQWKNDRAESGGEDD